MKQGPKKLTVHNYRYLINKFIKDPKILKPYDWARETKIAKTLIQKYGLEFLTLHFNNFKLNSLAWFLSKEGQSLLILEKVKQKTLTFSQEKVTIEDEKIEEDIKIQTKPKSIKEFLKYGKN